MPSSVWKWTRKFFTSISRPLEPSQDPEVHQWSCLQSWSAWARWSPEASFAEIAAEHNSTKRGCSLVCGSFYYDGRQEGTQRLYQVQVFQSAHLQNNRCEFVSIYLYLLSRLELSIVRGLIIILRYKLLIFNSLKFVNFESLLQCFL